MDGITKKDLQIIENPDFLNLTKLAVQFSDGIIIANKNVNATVEEYVKSSGKTYLPFNDPDNIIDEYAVFYEKILSESNN